jgi:hypothetical protein
MTCACGQQLIDRETACVHCGRPATSKRPRFDEGGMDFDCMVAQDEDNVFLADDLFTEAFAVPDEPDAMPDDLFIELEGPIEEPESSSDSEGPPEEPEEQGAASSSGLRREEQEEPAAAIVPAAALVVSAVAFAPAVGLASCSSGCDSGAPAAPMVFGFDSVPEVDAAIAAVILDAGLMSAKALAVPAHTYGGSAPVGSLDTLMSHFSGGTCVGRGARQIKIGLGVYFNLPVDVEDVYTHFKAHPAFAGYIGVLRRGNITSVLLIRSCMVTITAESLVIGGVAPRFEGRLQVRGKCPDRACSILENWCGFGEVFYGDFVVLDNRSEDSLPTYEQVQSVLHPLTDVQRKSLIETARMTSSKNRSPLQRAIASLGEKGLQPVPAPMTCVWTSKMAVEASVLDLDQFIGLENITLSRWCEHTDSTIEMPFLTYIENSKLFQRYSLVLLGPPGVGKSPLARSVCLVWAATLAVADGRPGHTLKFIECGTLDILRRMTSDCNEHTPVLFDEVSLADQTQCQHMSVNMAKLLLNSEVRAVLHGRKDDIALAAGQPRVFTSNASTFLEFVGMGMTESDIHFKAMRKRCFVAHLTRALVSPAVARRDADTTAPKDIAAGRAAVRAMLANA